MVEGRARGARRSQESRAKGVTGTQAAVAVALLEHLRETGWIIHVDEEAGKDPGALPCDPVSIHVVRELCHARGSARLEQPATWIPRVAANTAAGRGRHRIAVLVVDVGGAASREKPIVHVVAVLRDHAVAILARAVAHGVVFVRRGVFARSHVVHETIQLVVRVAFDRTVGFNDLHAASSRRQRVGE